jgi:hypothetical protein
VFPAGLPAGITGQRQYEIPVAFVEIGYVIAPDLTHHDMISFVSENPSGSE